MALLQLDRVSKHFSGLKAVDQVSFAIEEGQICGLIGPNGAGKSTCFNLIAGALKPTGGRVTFRGVDITGWEPHRVAAMGIGRTFQQTSVFPELNVYENVAAAHYLRTEAGSLDALLRTKRHRLTEGLVRDGTHAILGLLGLEDVADVEANSLPYGNLRKVGVAIALAARPALLLMDEPAAGLNPTESADLVRMTRIVRDQGITVLLVEHDMKVIMDVCDTLVVLSHGKKLSEGTPDFVRRDPAVIEAYLGTRAAEKA